MYDESVQPDIYSSFLNALEASGVDVIFPFLSRQHVPLTAMLEQDCVTP